MPETAGRPARRLSAHANAMVLNRLHARTGAVDILADAIRDQYPSEIALVSSFGADSAVLLHMVSVIDRTVPVLFLDTGMHFPETLDYQKRLARDLGLVDSRIVQPAEDDLTSDDPDSMLHAENPDGCCFLRKTLPLRRALEPFRAWITGRKRDQAATRASLDLFEEEAGPGRLKVNPLAGWSAADLKAYRDKHGLPPHPLVAGGFLSIGCAPCTQRVADGADPRSGRWAGQEKTECGIHFEGGRVIRAGAA